MLTITSLYVINMYIDYIYNKYMYIYYKEYNIYNNDNKYIFIIHVTNSNKPKIYV